jgi:hypothetical protein
VSSAEVAIWIPGTGETSAARREPVCTDTVRCVPAGTTFPNASRTGPNAIATLLRPSAVSSVRAANAAIEPAGAAGTTVIGPALSERALATSEAVSVRVSARVAVANVSNDPATRLPEAGAKETASVAPTITVPVPLIARFPNASSACTRTRAGTPAVHVTASGTTRRAAMADVPTDARMPTGAIEVPRAKIESAAGADAGARYRTETVPAASVSPAWDAPLPVVPPRDSSVPATGVPR